jgi:glycosyltransferase involved in cell wall biosynthesis
MLIAEEVQMAPPLLARRPKRSIVVGITHPQTCLTLTGHLRSLREEGFLVRLVSSPGALSDRTAEVEGVESISIPMRRGISVLADIVTLARLWLVLRRMKPDLTEFSTPKAGLLGTMAARFAGVPRRIYMLRGLKLERSKGLKRHLLLMSERIAAACADVVLCNSASLRAEALALGIGSDAKLHLLGSGSSNGVDVQRFTPGPNELGQSLGLPADAKVVGFVGRLTRDKGIPELMEAFELILAVLPKARLLLVGWFDASEDALSEELKARIAAHPQIHMTGFVNDTAPYYRAMDVMVLPTWREGFPNVVLEAAATGIPVVTTISTGSRDSVVPEVTGLLIPPGYPEAISEAVLRLLRDGNLRWRMGLAARAWVLEHFVDERVLGLTAAFYRTLLESGMAEES